MVTLLAATLAWTALGLPAQAPVPAAGDRHALVASLLAPARELALRRGRWIYLMREDGGGLRRLTRGASPSWSPDGQRLVFSHRDRLWVIDADGRGLRRLVGGSGLAPAWSPDGRRVAFTSRRSGQMELYVLRLDGGAPRRLTFRRRRDEDSHSPQWSPSGRRLVFASNRPALFNPEIYVIRPDGRALRRLTFTGGADAELGDDGMPHFAPDGRRIAFSSNRTQDGGIWTMRSDGRRQEELLNLTGTDEWYPRFSPDGARIAFTRVPADGREELWVMRADGTGAERLTAGADPAWRPAAPAQGQRRGRGGPPSSSASGVGSSGEWSPSPAS